MSQRALGVAAGIPQSTIARIETGVLAPRTTTLERILAATGRTLTSEPRAGDGIDRSQIKELLALTPGQRLRLAAADATALDVLDAARAPRA